MCRINGQFINQCTNPVKSPPMAAFHDPVIPSSDKWAINSSSTLLSNFRNWMYFQLQVQTVKEYSLILPTFYNL